MCPSMSELGGTVTIMGTFVKSRHYYGDFVGVRLAFLSRATLLDVAFST